MFWVSVGNYLSFKCNSLCLSVGFEDGRLKLDFVRASCDHPFCHIEIQMCPLCDFLEFVDLGFKVVYVVYEDG